MNIINTLSAGNSIVCSILVLALVIVVGILLSKVTIRGWSLGVTWVLFTAIAAGHFGLSIDPLILRFIKEIGMVLFVYAIGMLVGPSFFSAFRQGGLQLNLLAIAVVGMGLMTTYVIYMLSGTPIETMMGIMSGAVTNTPMLGAVQETVQSVRGEVLPDVGIGYALAYPVAIISLILTNIGIKLVFRIKVDQEEAKLEEQKRAKQNDAIIYTVEVSNPSVFGKNIYSITQLLKNHDVVISRIQHAESGVIEIVNSATVVHRGDKLLMISKEIDAKLICTVIGNVVEMNDVAWSQLDQRFVSRNCLVTKSEINGKSIGQLRLRNLYNVNISRVQRAGLYLVAEPDLRLQIGDMVIIVGQEQDVHNVEQLLGNSVSSLKQPNLLVIFIGILLGVTIGSIPILFPGIPFEIKLGLSGGTLLIAILMSNFGTHLGLNTHNTTSVNFMLRDIGITLFLACVGLNVGSNFVETLLNGGFIWMLYAAVITLIPLWIVCVVGRLWLRLDYFTLLGFIAGSLTFAPALSLSADAGRNNIASVKYATVYPLTMFLRVITAQWILLLLL